MRKIIQITGELTNAKDSLVALCDDGTLWVRILKEDEGYLWKPISLNGLDKLTPTL